MKKKSLIILFTMLAVLFIFCNKSFANETLKNDIQDVGNDIMNGANNLASDVRNGVGAIENTAENGLNAIGSGITDTMNNMGNMLTTDTMNNDDGYAATRTSITDTNNNYTTSTMWTWIALGIAAAVIVGLVWYYGTENDIER